MKGEGAKGKKRGRALFLKGKKKKRVNENKPLFSCNGFSALLPCRSSRGRAVLGGERVRSQRQLHPFLKAACCAGLICQTGPRACREQLSGLHLPPPLVLPQQKKTPNRLSLLSRGFV